MIKQFQNGTAFLFFNIEPKSEKNGKMPKCKIIHQKCNEKHLAFWILVVNLQPNKLWQVIPFLYLPIY